MKEIRFDVLAVHAALTIWLVLAVSDYKKQSYTAAIAFGIAIVVVRNVRYLIEGAAKGIVFFIPLYDVFDNLGLDAGETAPALTTCSGNGGRGTPPNTPGRIRPVPSLVPEGSYPGA